MKKFAFICDFFVNDGIGGAELTTDAIMTSGNKRGHPIVGINCQSVTKDILNNEKENFHFIVGNFFNLSDEVKIYMCKNVSYSIIEYDYKICEHRSLQLHKLREGSDCDCETRKSGQINSAFYGYADKIWFMSEEQKQIFLSKVKVLKEENCEVLSSVFNVGDLRFMNNIKDNKKNDNYLIMTSQHWIKNVENTVEYAKENKLNYELVGSLPYHEFLIKLSTSKGLIFHPRGHDTCPRLAIEAKLLGCELLLNDNVQHKNEDWFQSQDSCLTHMNSRTEAFWSYYEKQ